MKLIFVTGGARSGKSKFACQLAEKCSARVTYVATAEAKDQEMQERIEEHRRKRPSHWKLVEEPRDILKAIQQTKGSDCIIVDCLTLLITNWLLDDSPRRSSLSEHKILEKISVFLQQLAKLSTTVIIVSNEVGMGVVPEKKLGRIFRDICGQANQLVADKADEVYFMISGIPLKVK